MFRELSIYESSRTHSYGYIAVTKIHTVDKEGTKLSYFLLDKNTGCPLSSIRTTTIPVNDYENWKKSRDGFSGAK